MEFNIGCLQFNSAEDIASNIKKIDPMIEDAKNKGCDVLLLPENVSQMPLLNAEKAYTEDKNPFLSFIQQRAQHHRMFMIVGSLPIQSVDTKKCFNRSYVVSNEGKVIARYDKIHLFKAQINNQSYDESEFFLAGNKAFVCDTPFVPLGLSICYDLRFPHLYRALALAGAAVIVVPSAFTKITGALHWEVLLRARAIETGCYVVAANQCGRSSDGRETYGHSMIISPDGSILNRLGDQEGVMISKINTDDTHEMRQKIGSLFSNPLFNVEVIK